MRAVCHTSFAEVRTHAHRNFVHVVVRVCLSVSVCLSVCLSVLGVGVLWCRRVVVSACCGVGVSAWRDGEWCVVSVCLCVSWAEGVSVGGRRGDGWLWSVVYGLWSVVCGLWSVVPSVPLVSLCFVHRVDGF